MKGKSRIVLAEDHGILREGLRMILSQDPQLSVVAEAADGLEAVRCAEELQPDLVVLDISMPLMNGLEALKEISRVAPAARTLVLTVHKSEEYLHAALRAGASGYMLKDATSAELLLAVSSVLSGQRYISSHLAAHVISGYLGAKDGDLPKSPFEELSDREREILKLIAEGHRNREVADLLFISEKTVEKHRANLMRKLNLRGAQALTTYAVSKGLINP